MSVTSWWELGFVISKDDGVTFEEDEGTADYSS
jgi:hypothetical protein